MAENARNIPYSFFVRMQFYAQLNNPSLHILDAFSSFTSRNFNSSFSALRCFFFYHIQMQFISSFNQSIAFIIPVLTTFLQLKFQNKSPFLTHPRTMRVAVCSSVVYELAYIALLTYPLPRFAVVIANHFLVSIGNVAVASLASVLLPDSFTPFVYAIFGLISASELLYWLYHDLVADNDDDAEFWIRRRRVARFLNNIWRAVRSSAGQRQHILPLYG